MAGRRMNFMPLLHVFPVDLVLLIREHAAAAHIQRRARLHSYRHTTAVFWHPLRRKIFSQLCSWRQFDTLQRSSLVRREWRSEPESWLRSLQEDACMAPTIVAEVVQGWWDVV